jgi:hypothetical protein
MPAETQQYYGAGEEDQRLLSGSGPLEFARTQDILLRCLPAAPAVVVDAGGGTGSVPGGGGEILSDRVRRKIASARQLQGNGWRSCGSVTSSA